MTPKVSTQGEVQPNGSVVLSRLPDRLVGESALEALIARRSVLVDDDPHRDAAGRADRRALVVNLGLAILFHATSLARPPRGSFRNASVQKTVGLLRTDRPNLATPRVNDAQRPQAPVSVETLQRVHAAILIREVR